MLDFSNTSAQESCYDLSKNRQICSDSLYSALIVIPEVERYAFGVLSYCSIVVHIVLYSQVYYQACLPSTRYNRLFGVGASACPFTAIS